MIRIIRIPPEDILEKFYHLSRGAELSNALDYIVDNFQTCINQGILTRLKKQLDIFQEWIMNSQEKIQYLLLYARINEALGNYEDAINNLNKLMIENNIVSIKDKYSFHMALFRCYEKTANYEL